MSHRMTYLSVGGGFTQTTPTTEPVTLAEVKQHVRCEVDDDDALIDDLITQAREEFEASTNRQLNSSTVTLKLNRFPYVGESGLYHNMLSDIVCPRPPLSSVSSITYVDTDGTTATVATTVYGVDTTSEPGRIYLLHSQVWPTPLEQTNAVTVTLVAGYGSAASDVPERAKGAIKLLVGHWYNNREAVAAAIGGVVQKVPLSFERLVWSLKVPDASS